MTRSADLGAGDTLLGEARRHLAEAIDFRRRLHRIPEVGLDLPKTQAAVVEAIRALGLSPVHGSSTSSVWADITGGRPGGRVLLRADMDALPIVEVPGPFSSTHPGMMHACGHDAHTAVLLLAARLLLAHRERIRGSVRLMFQAGEEGHFGAKRMIDDGVLEGVDAAFALHVAPQLPAGTVATRRGPMMAAADIFAVEYTGQGGHGASPHLTNDPIQAAAAFVHGVNSFVARRTNPLEPIVVSITAVKSSGGKSVLADRVELEGTVRTFDRLAREAALGGLRELALQIARTYGCEAAMSRGSGYSAVINDAAMTDRVLDAARKVTSPARCVELKAPQMAADDFAHVLERVPGAFWLLGACPADTRARDAAPVHSPHFRICEDAFPIGAAVHAQIVLDHLQ